MFLTTRECLLHLLAKNRPMRMSRRFLTILIVVLLLPLRGLQWILFGYGSTRIGGQMGRFVDNLVRRMCFEHQATRQQQERFHDIFGYQLPGHSDPSANHVGVHVLLNNYIVEAMIHMKARRDAVTAHETQDASCPLHMLVPLRGDWYRPTEWVLPTHNQTNDSSSSSDIHDKLSALYFDTDQMDEFMMEHFDKLHQMVYQRLSELQRIQLFGFLSVYRYGGMFVSPDISDTATLHTVAPGLSAWLQSLNCSSSEATMFYQSVNNRSVTVLAATPHHPRIMCAIQALLGDAQFDDIHNLMQHNHWDPTCKPDCCLLQELPETADVLANRNVPETADDKPRFQVTIHEELDTNQPFWRTKERVSDKLRRGWCSPGWPCNRCLRMPFLGSLHSCRWLCRPCYKRHVCVAQDYKTVHMEVQVTETKYSRKKRIPPILHQTWFEPLSTARYPHFQRLQNSWKASGWDYRFYTDSDCVDYIQRNYPDRFVQAFTAILPGAFKADFFRLLVLFKEGGVYADVDVQLESNLDQFISQDMSLFIPRDSPLDYWPDSNYFLWNGLMGAAPGHPILAKAIGDILTKILNRADYYDVEGSMCALDPNAKIWKLRTLPILILTGPCSLGMSVNEVLGNSDLMQGYNVGWLPSTNFTLHNPPDLFWGHGLILLADKHDLNEMRFTDVERNLVVATTNHDRIATSPIEYGTQSVPKKKLIHYSKGETDIVGEFGVYADDKVTGERIKLRITHEYR